MAKSCSQPVNLPGARPLMNEPPEEDLLDFWPATFPERPASKNLNDSPALTRHFFLFHFQAILEQELRPYFDGKWKGLADPHLSGYGTLTL